MANATTPVEKKPEIKIRGTVDFYGYVDNFNKDGKEYVLAIRDYDILNYDPDVVAGWYKDKDGKPQKLPAIYEKLNKGEKPESIYFRSEYPVDNIQIVKDGTVEPVKIDYSPDLKGMRVIMTMYRQFIGYIAMKELPPEYKRVAFDASEFEDL